MNFAVLEKAAEIWVDVYDFHGSGAKIRTIPVKPTLHQAGKTWGKQGFVWSHYLVMYCWYESSKIKGLGPHKLGKGC